MTNKGWINVIISALIGTTLAAKFVGSPLLTILALQGIEFAILLVFMSEESRKAIGHYVLAIYILLVLTALPF